MFAPLNSEETAILARLPIVNRARGSRLYTDDGKRWIDCWADGGRALAGHKPDGVSLRLKNEIDRGLFAAYPNRWQNRLIKAMLKLFPGYGAARVFQSAGQALKSIPANRWPIDPLDVPPGTEFISGPVWGRPQLPNHPKGDYLLPILPLPGLSEVQSVLYAHDTGDLPASDMNSPLILAALTRACYSVSSCMDKRHVNGVISRKNEIRDGGNRINFWEMRGPYMVYKGDERNYEEIFESYFSQSVLIAPSVKRPSVLPLNPSMGELKKLFFCCNI
ncbi:MAG: hypothetical protein B6D68_02740 [spirochete symbiont of Stewartia floridana]|nr:MAG: hypothetical protein B6D68_02740 [spirochete symbiont of Stewartia floridana]